MNNIDIFGASNWSFDVHKSNKYINREASRWYDRHHNQNYWKSFDKFTRTGENFYYLNQVEHFEEEKPEEILFQDQTKENDVIGTWDFETNVFKNCSSPCLRIWRGRFLGHRIKS